MDAAKSIFVDAPATPSRPLVIRRLELTPKAAPRPADDERQAIGRVALVPKPAAPPKPDDAALIAILDGPMRGSETVAAGFARKEQELGAAFARLSVIEARTMHARLANPAPGDHLAAKFARLTIERRTRLLVFLADARRREALRGR